MADELRTPLTGNTGSSFTKACFNGINAFFGVGLLVIPYALSSGGWLSLVLFCLISMITFYTGILVKRCMEIDPSITSFLDIGKRAFGTRGKIIVSIIMNSELYITAIGLLILEGDNLHKLFPNFMVKLGTLTVDGTQSFVIITAFVILPSLLLPDLSKLSYVSATGIFSCLIIFGSIFCVGAIGGVGFHAKGSLLNLSGIRTAVSLCIACFAGHPVIPSIYSSMRHKNQFSQVLLFSFVVTSIAYMAIAAVAYLMYGDSVESQITLNLPTTEIYAKVAIYTTLLIPVTRYALILNPVATAIEGGLSENHKNWRPVRSLIRITLLISTVFVAYIFPYYESLVANAGSILVVLSSFLTPCICYLKIFYSYRGWSWSYELMGIVGIILFGTFFGVLGTYSDIVKLVDSLSKHFKVKH